MRTPRRHAVCVVTATLVGALLLAGCSTTAASTTDPPATSPPPSTPSSAPPSVSSTPDPSAALEAAVLAAYHGFWRAQVATLNHPQRKPDPGLKRYAIDKALAGVGASWLIYRRNGVENRGQPVLDPKLIGWSNGAGSTASITDCVDSTNWQPVFVKTGKSAAAPNQLPRIVVESTVVKYDGRWVVRTSVSHRDQPC